MSANCSRGNHACSGNHEAQLTAIPLRALFFGVAGWIIFFLFSLLDFILSKLFGNNAIILTFLIAISCYEFIANNFFSVVSSSKERTINCLKKGLLLFCLKYKYRSRDLNSVSPSLFRVVMFSSNSAIQEICCYFLAYAMGVTIWTSSSLDDDLYLTCVIEGCLLKSVWWGWQYFFLAAPLTKEVCANDHVKGEMQSFLTAVSETNWRSISHLRLLWEYKVAKVFVLIIIGISISLLPPPFDDIEIIAVNVYMGYMSCILGECL